MAAQPWPAWQAREYQAQARYLLRDHIRKSADVGLSPLERENCGACVLEGYKPPGGYGDPELDAPGAGPNYAGWARVYVQAQRPIPAKWRQAFFEQRYHSGNAAYSAALERDIATWGLVFDGKDIRDNVIARGPVKHLPPSAWGMSRRRRSARPKWTGRPR